MPPPSSLDLAHTLVLKQNRQLVDPPTLQPPALGMRAVPPASALLQIPLAGTAEAKAVASFTRQIAQLAESVSLLVASLQRRCDEDKEELEQCMDKIDARLEARLSSMEARLSEDGGRDSREAHRGLIAALSEVPEAKYRSELAELRSEQHESLRQLEELALSSHQNVLRVEKVERAALAQERCLRRVEETVEAMGGHPMDRVDSPPWFGQLEGALLSLDHRCSEQQTAMEVQLARLQVECDGLRRRAEVIGGLRDEVLQAVQEKIEAAVPRSLHERLPAATECALLRRIDDLEARTAAQRVKVDAHEARFGAFSERLEAACQEAVAQARVVAQQRRDELLKEVDCQLRVLRKRMDSFTELGDELMFKASAQCGTAAGSHVDFSTNDMRGKLPSLTEEVGQ